MPQQTFQPLSPEQYQKARTAGFSPDQIIENEKIRKSQTETPPAQTADTRSGLRKVADFVAPLAGDAYDFIQGKNTKTPAQILGDTALTAAWFVPVVGPAAKAAEGAGMLSRLAGSTALKGAGIGYGTGVSSDLAQGKSVSESFTPDINKAVGTVAGGLTGGLLGRASGGAGVLEKGAQKNIYDVLAPTTKVNKQITQKIAPELAQKTPIAMTRQGLLTKYQALQDEAGQKLEGAYEALPQNAKFEVTGLFDTVQKKIDDLTINGAVPSAAQAKVNALQNMMKDLANLGMETNDNLINKGLPGVHGGINQVFSDVANVRKLRQLLDQGKRNFSFTDLDSANQGAQKFLANSIRDEFGKQFPDIAKLNKEYSFWSKASKVLSDTIERKTGQSGIVRKMGEGALGALAGIPSGHPIIGSAIWTGLAELIHSPVWKTTGALTKSRLSTLMQKGDEAGLHTLITALLRGSPSVAAHGAQIGTNMVLTPNQ